MNKEVSSTLDFKSLRTFLLIAFLLAWLLFFLPLGFKEVAPQNYQMLQTISFSLAMWAPGIAAIVATKQADGSLDSLRIKSL